MKFQTESSSYRDSTRSLGRNATAFHACIECTHFCLSGHPCKRDQFTPVHRFVKVLIGGDNWDKILLLPPAFAPTVEDLVGKETEIENAVGEKWTVTLSSYNGRIGFLNGWKDFVMDHRLDAGDFLVFNYIEGSNFTVHIYGKHLCEKNRNGSFGKKHHQGNVSAQLKPCDRKDSGVKGRLLQSQSVASRSKSGPSVPRGVFKSSSAYRPQLYRGDHSMLNKSNKRSYFEEHEIRRPPSRNREGIDGGMLASNLVHKEKRSQAKSDKYRVETEHLKLNRIPKVTDASMFTKDHAYMGSIGEGQEDSTWTEKVMSKTFTKAAHVSRAEKDNTYMGSMSEGKGERILTENVRSKTFTKATQVSVTEKDRPLMFRDDSTHKCESKTNASLSSSIHFKLHGEEPGKKGNDGSSACEREGAVSPNCGHTCTGNLRRIVIDELPERSEPGYYNAKRKRDEGAAFPSFGHLYTGNPKNIVLNERPQRSEPRNYDAKRKIDLNSPPRGITTMKQVKAEPCDSYSSELGIVTCPAVASGERLELPDKLPALRYLKRGGKAIFLLDQRSTMWPALYEERSGVQVLICNWDKFNPDNEIGAGDKFVLTVEDAVQFIYRINVIRPIQIQSN